MKAPTENVEAAQCRVCHEIKLASHFLRSPTHKQLEAWGYRAEHAKDYKYVSTTCHACKPVRKLKPDNMTRKQLEDAMRYGALSPVDVNLALYKREGLRKQRGKSARIEGWVKHWRTWWKVLISDVSQECRSVTYQLRNARTSKDPDSHHANAFFLLYREVLEQLRNSLRFAAHRCESAPPTERWLECVDPLDKEALRLMWRRVTTARRIPLVLDRSQETDVFHEIYPHATAQRRLTKVQMMIKPIKVGGPTNKSSTDSFVDEMLRDLGLEPDME